MARPSVARSEAMRRTINKAQGFLRQLHNEYRDKEATFQATVEEQEDMYFFMQKKLDDNFERITELEKELLRTNVEMERMEKQFSKSQEEQEIKHREAMSGVEDQAHQVRRSLGKLKNLPEEKDMVDRSLKDLQAALDSEEELRKEADTEINRSHVQEKEAIKRRMILRIREEKQQLLNHKGDVVEERTFQVAQDQQTTSSQLAVATKEVHRLVQSLEKAIEEGRELKRELGLRNETEHALSERAKKAEDALANVKDRETQQMLRASAEIHPHASGQRHSQDPSHEIIALEQELTKKRQRLWELRQVLERASNALGVEIRKDDQAFSFLFQCLQLWRGHERCRTRSTLASCQLPARMDELSEQGRQEFLETCVSDIQRFRSQCDTLAVEAQAQAIVPTEKGTTTLPRLMASPIAGPETPGLRSSESGTSIGFVSEGSIVSGGQPQGRKGRNGMRLKYSITPSRAGSAATGRNKHRRY